MKILSAIATAGLFAIACTVITGAALTLSGAYLFDTHILTVISEWTFGYRLIHMLTAIALTLTALEVHSET